MTTEVHHVVSENLDTILDLEQQLYACFTPFERIAYRTTRLVGRIESILLQLVFAIMWIIANTHAVNTHPIDPWPFQKLGLFLAFESVILTLFVLTSQRVLQKLEHHRAHLALQISLLNEQETTKVLHVLARMEERLGGSCDEQLAAFTEEVDARKVSAAIKKSLENHGPDAG